MDSLLTSFNSMSTTEFLPKVKMTDLSIGVEYPVRKFRVVAVKDPLFGAKVGGAGKIAVIAEIDFLKEIKEGCGRVGEIFLPRRFNSILTESVVEKYNERPDSALVFKGVGTGREYVVSLVKSIELNEE